MGQVDFNCPTIIVGSRTRTGIRSQAVVSNGIGRGKEAGEIMCDEYVILAEGFDAVVFESLEQLCRSLEPQDVRQTQYLVFDGRGRTYTLRAGRGAVADVHADRAPEVLSEAERLSLLRTYVRAQQPPQEAEVMTVEELLGALPRNSTGRGR